MNADVNFKHVGNKETFRNVIKSYICNEVDQYDEYILKYADKFIWIFFYEEPTYNFINVKFSNDLTASEIDAFIEELTDKGLVIDPEPPF